MAPRLHGRAAFLDMLLAALRETPCAPLPPFSSGPSKEFSNTPKALASKLLRHLQDRQSQGATATS
jgi:hypothetical protein